MMPEPIDIPHFSFPFTFGTSRHANVVEQDTIDDVVGCISVALLTEIGFRPEVPTFGTTNRVFDMQPLDLVAMLSEVEEWESRGEMIMTQSPDERDNLIARITALVSLRRADQDTVISEESNA